MKTLPSFDSVEYVSGIRERVQWIIANRPDWSARSLSKKAGMSEAYVRKLMEREPQRPDAAALAKIAVLTGVSPNWLIFGIGQPHDIVAPDESNQSATASTPPAAPIRPPMTRQALIESLARGASDLSLAGDHESASVAADALARLLGQGPLERGRVLEPDEEAPEGESHRRRSFPKPTGTGG